MKRTSFPQRIRLVVAALCAVMLPFFTITGASAHDRVPTHHATRTWHVLVGEEAQADAIQGMAFLPGTIWINAGDRITWTANAGEPHTVTFLAKGQPLTPFNPFDPNELQRRGGRHYDGVSYFNSGVMSNEKDPLFPATLTYTLSFPKVGTFTYWCLVHGSVMKGVVHVRAAGTRYPFSQKQYDQQGIAQSARIFADGRRLWFSTAQQATHRTVFLGADDGVAMIMRFIRPTVRVHVGQTVTFRNVGMAAPHTVTFGPERMNIFVAYGNPKKFSGGQLNSGIIPPGASFKVTFKKAGTYPYICALHDNLGMVGTVVVTGR